MGLIVQKYGGSSVADPDRILAVSDRIRRTIAQGHQVVVIVSAMGKTTDQLLELGRKVTGDRLDDVGQREIDLLLATGEQVTTALLAMALQAQAQPAIALNGAQVKILTEPCHQRARILQIETERIRQHLQEGKVVVITGFQGVQIDASTEITTIGRGGSDTSAVAIAAALSADLCEIYTDVAGIYSTDPRLVPRAKLIPAIACDEMLELASMGAKVLHPRAVEIARNFGIRLAVRSSWLEDAGTIVLSPNHSQGSLTSIEINRFVEGITLDTDSAQIALLQVPDRPGIAAQVFEALATAGIDVNLIVQAVQEPAGVNDIAFTVSKPDAVLAQTIVSKLGLGTVVADTEIAIVSILGVGIVGRPAIPAQMFTALAQAKVNILMISTSEIKVSCTIKAGDQERAVQALKQTFGVEVICEQPACVTTAHAPVTGVALDQNRARIAVSHVPDRPGVAAHLVQALAHAGIGVDMIVQSQSQQDQNEIAFTVNSGDRYRAEQILKQVVAELGSGIVTSDDGIAKVSIVGMGMTNQPGVAAKVFRAIADAGINIEMIATSEIKVSCILRQEQAVLALQQVHRSFLE
ncbi:MAG: aspartate kinase [Pseudanabaenaceae cyanobacterium]